MKRHPLPKRAKRGASGWVWLTLCFAALAVPGRPARADDDVLPQAFPASRYAKMGAHSPFSPPTIAAPVAAVIVPTVGWADKLSVTLLMEQGGQYVATLLDKDSSQRFRVSSKPEENDRNIVLSSVQWGDHINETRVTLRKGTELGQVGFDPTMSTAGSPGASGPIPRPFSPGQSVFHPPPAPNAGLAGEPGAIVRRPEISSAPINGPRALPNRAPVRPLANGDDDDDDDDK